MRAVTTFAAGEFVCDDCGRNNYFRWRPVDPADYSRAELSRIKNWFGCKSDSELHSLWTEPPTVRCACGAEFDVCHGPEHMGRRPVADTFHAGEFTCPDCDALTMFSLAAVDEINMPKELIKKVRASSGMPAGKKGIFVMVPEMLTCCGCGSEFEPDLD